jgi:hypothetical protein
MTKNFSEKDLDRSWSSGEVAALSEIELTKLAFLRDYKNFIFFVPAGCVLYLVCGSLGIVGKIMGWIGIVMFGLFALQGLFNTGVVFISLLGTPFMDKASPVKNSIWKSLQLAISFGNFAIYAALAFLVYAGLYQVDLEKYAPW